MLSRRDFLAAAGGSLIVGMVTPVNALAKADATGKPIYSGWVPDERSTINFKTQQKTPMFRQAAKALAGSGRGKKALLWKFFEKVTGKPFVPHDQAIGDCVAHGWGLGVDFLDAIQIAHGRGEWQK